MKKISVFNNNIYLFRKHAIINKIFSSISLKVRTNLIAIDFRDFLFLRNNRLKIYREKHSFCYPDSIGGLILVKFRDYKKSKGFNRLISTDIHFHILNFCINNNIKIFFWGDSDSTLNLLRIKLPNNIIAGCLDGFGNYSDEYIISTINNSGATVLLIGLGVPKQIQMLDKFDSYLLPPVRITVGAFFSFITKQKIRAPKIFRVFYLEWFFRFAQEPVRLFKRYFIQFPHFLFILIFRDLQD